MQPERFVTCGLVLRETVTRDADKILTVVKVEPNNHCQRQKSITNEYAVGFTILFVGGQFAPAIVVIVHCRQVVVDK